MANYTVKSVSVTNRMPRKYDVSTHIQTCEGERVTTDAVTTICTTVDEALSLIKQFLES